MAFERQSGSAKFIKATGLMEGEALVAYLVGTSESPAYPGKFDLLLKNIDKELVRNETAPDGTIKEVKIEPGEEYVLATAGTLKYYAKDVNDRKFPLRNLVQIKRQPSYKNKRNQVVSSFEVLMDKEQSI